jgi:hypothetical protein
VVTGAELLDMPECCWDVRRETSAGGAVHRENAMGTVDPMVRAQADLKADSHRDNTLFV